jgi:hypothetical protein
MRITCSACGCFLELDRMFVSKKCLTCQREYNREYRKDYTPSIPYQKKQKSRTLANNGLKRGKLIRKPCEKCGDSKAEMHHEDYDRPLEVIWLCRKCHLDLHTERNRSQALEEVKSNINTPSVQAPSVKI